MAKVLDSIDAGVSEVVDSAAGRELHGAEARRRERAERLLGRELLRRGLLTG